MTSLPMLKVPMRKISQLRGQMTAWLAREHPDFYVRQKRLGTHTGVHRLKDDTEFLKVHARVTEAEAGIIGLRERYNLWMLARAAQRFSGEMAEVGVFRGGSAMILAAAKGAAELHLFDTFAGMPETDQKHDGIFTAGMFGGTSLAEVQALLSPYSNVHFHPGFFPESAKDLRRDIRFKLTNIDVDIRSSTLSCLEYFYPRTVPGGFIVLHDYNDCGVPGVKVAVQEFMQDKPETVLELWDTQAMIVKQ